MDIGYLPTEEQFRLLASQKPTDEVAIKSSSAISSRSLVAINKSTGSLPTKNVREIYRRRAKLNLLKRGSIEGFDQLVPVLESTDERTIDIAGFETPKDIYVFFSNSTMTKLLGILCIPKMQLDHDAGNLCK